MLYPFERICTFCFNNIRCILILQFSASRVSVVGIRVSFYRLDVRGIAVWLPAGVMEFFLFQALEVVSGADSASYLVGTGASFRWVNRPGRGVDHSPQSSPELKNEWSYSSAPTYAIMLWIGTALNVLCARSNSFLLLPSLLQSSYYYVPNDCKLFHFSFVVVIRSVCRRVANTGFARHASVRVPWRKQREISLFWMPLTLYGVWSLRII